MINGFIGTMGHKLKKSKKIILTRSIDCAYLFFTNKHSFVTNHRKDNFYEVGIRTEKYIEDSYVPIFNQILDLEAIELYKITKFFNLIMVLLIMSILIMLL